VTSSNLSKIPATWNARGLSATAELLVICRYGRGLQQVTKPISVHQLVINMRK